MYSVINLPTVSDMNKYGHYQEQKEMNEYF